jgi:hypothetical protein
MLSKCLPEASEFFSHILDSADKNGHTIYWGSSGFSIRVHLPESDGPTSIFYGYPPHIFQVFFAYLPFSEEQILTLRNEILRYGIFKEAPKSLSVNLDSNNLKKAEEAYELVLRRVEEISKT